MDTSRTAPHVNFELLKNFQNQTVRLVGEVTGTSGNLLHVKAADGGMVDVTLSQPGSVTDKYVLITGTATAGNTMNEDKHQALGNDYDLAKHNEMCKLASSPEFRGLFLP